MPGENTVLVLDRDGDVQRLKLAAVSENNIPETLNGESGFHIYHVRMLTELILNQLKKQGDCSLSDEDVQSIAVAASLHDIGKSQIPKSILDFPGKLSPVEYDIVKKHAVFGETIINELDFGAMDPKIRQYAAEIARALLHRCSSAQRRRLHGGMGCFLRFQWRRHHLHL